MGFNDNNNLFRYSFSTAICNKWYIFKLSSCYFQITYLDIHLKNTRELVWVVEGNLCKTPLNRLVNLKVFDHHNNSYISLECNNLVKYLGVLISLACVSSEIRNLQCVFLRIQDTKGESLCQAFLAETVQTGTKNRQVTEATHVLRRTLRKY